MSTPLSLRDILRFWLPLAATWLMMGIEGPYLAAIIARIPDAKYNLAAHGVAFSIALVIEAPVIMLMSAATALVNSRASYLKLRNFTRLLNIGCTAGMALVTVPVIFDTIALRLLNLPPEVAVLTHTACILFIPWPGAIGVRRFYQGILIRNGRTRLVAYGTVLRLVSMSGAAFYFYHFTEFSGAATAAASLSTGVMVEALSTRLMARPTLRKLMTSEQENDDDRPLNYRYLVKFYLPLALTPIIALGAQPVITFFMTQARMPINSLAVFPVIHSLVFLFRCMGISYMEVVVARLGPQQEGLQPLRRFATYLGTVVTVGLVSIAATPLFDVWFIDISGISPELAEFAHVPTLLFVLMPALSVLLSFQRGVLVTAHNTTPITLATLLEFAVILIVMSATVFYMDWVGAVAGVIALVTGRMVAVAYLFGPFLKVTRKNR